MSVHFLNVHKNDQIYLNDPENIKYKIDILSDVTQINEMDIKIQEVEYYIFTSMAVLTLKLIQNRKSHSFVPNHQVNMIIIEVI